MLPGIRFQVSEVRRPERVGQSADAGNSQNRGTPFRDTVNRDVFRSRSDEPVNEPPAVFTRPRSVTPGLPSSGSAELQAMAFGTLNRALQAFSSSENAGDGPAVEGPFTSPASVPYEALQRAVSAQSLPTFDGPVFGEASDEQAAANAGGEPTDETVGAFEKPAADPNPFQTAKDKTKSDAQLFQASKEVAQPFGREIPFDLAATEDATEDNVFAPTKNARTDLATRLSGSQPPLALDATDQQEVDRLQARQHDVQSAELLGELAAGTRSSSAYVFETGPDGKQYTVGARLNLDVAPVFGAPEAAQKKLESVKLATGTMHITQSVSTLSDEAGAAVVEQSRAQVASERYRSAEQNQFENVLAVSPAGGSSQRWSRIGIARPTFAISLTV
jgi:hypothetical protein